MPRLALLRNALFGGGAPVITAKLPLTLQKLEFELAGVGMGWTDVTCDVRESSMVVCEYGINGNSPSDRIASTGTLTFDLDNGGRNPIGWYSPMNPNRRPGFNLNIGVRYSVGPAPSGPRQFKHQGKVAIAIPVVGIEGERFTSCIARDLWDDYARTPMPDLPVQIDQKSHQLVNTLLNALPARLQPEARTTELGLETYVRAFDGGTGQQLTIREGMYQICLSENGAIYTRGSNSTASYLYFENRQHRSNNPAIAFTIDDTMMLTMDAPGSRDDIYGTVRVIVHPITEDVVPNREVAKLQTGTLRINVGETVEIFLPYRDSSDNLIGAVNQISPAAFQDYTFNTQENGSGTDITSNLTVAVVGTFSGEGARLALTNAGAFVGFVTRLVVRGSGLIRSDVLLEQVIAGAYGDQVYTYDMPYQSSVTAGQAILDSLVAKFASPFANVPSVTFPANLSQARFNAMEFVEIGERIILSEQVSGIESQPFTINKVRLETDAAGFTWCTWGLEQASAQQFWLMGVPGVSEIGVTTVVGF
jgi:hypothetical protein